MRRRICMVLLLTLLATTSQGQQSRWVVAGGALTEILFALGADRHIVAVDTTSRYPQAATNLPNVGYVWALASEGVLSLRPERLITTPDAGPPATLTQLQRAGVTVTTVDEPRTLDDVFSRIRQLAALADQQSQGEAIIRQQQQALSLRPDAPARRAVVLLDAGGNGLLGAGRDTQGDTLLSLAGQHNLLADQHRGYRPIGREALLALQPDLVVIARHGQEQGERRYDNLLAATPAGLVGRIHVDGSMRLLGFGLRLPAVLTELAEIAAAEAP